MIEIKQITPDLLFDHKNNLDKFLKDEFKQLTAIGSWMTEWHQVAQRFQLNKIKEMSETELKDMAWNKERIDTLIIKTFKNVNETLNFENISITVLPAFPFSYFKKQPQKYWSNAFTNGPGNIFIAIPPEADEGFFQYLLAHECHHASPDNPIYNLSLDKFTLEEWYKMEGTAEFFSLSLYPDKRWWKDLFTEEVERLYWRKCKRHLKTTDDRVKSKLCFGSEKENIPVFSGYSFAYNVISKYAASNEITDIKELFNIEPEEYFKIYVKNT